MEPIFFFLPEKKYETTVVTKKDSIMIMLFVRHEECEVLMGMKRTGCVEVRSFMCCQVEFLILKCNNIRLCVYE